MMLTRWASGAAEAVGGGAPRVPDHGEPSQAIFPFWTKQGEDWSELTPLAALHPNLKLDGDQHF